MLAKFMTMLVASIMLLTTLLSNTCLACSCIPLSMEQKIQRAESIYSGRVTGIWYSKERSQPQIEITVDQIWKGDAAPTRMVTSYLNTAACGVAFTYGQKYIVFQQADGSTSFCSGTAADNEKDAAALGEPAATFANDETTLAAGNKVVVYYQNNQLAEAIIDERGRALLPVQDEWLTELGIERKNDPTNLYEIHLARGDMLELYVGTNQFVHHTGITYMDTLTLRVSDTVYIPLRAVLETLGYHIEWNDELAAVMISKVKHPRVPLQEIVKNDWSGITKAEIRYGNGHLVTVHDTEILHQLTAHLHSVNIAIADDQTLVFGYLYTLKIYIGETSVTYPSSLQFQPFKYEANETTKSLDEFVMNLKK